MKTTKILKLGKLRVLELSKDFQFKSNEVQIFKRNGDIIVRETPKNLTQAFHLLTKLSNCFIPGNRIDAPPQKRDGF